MEKVLQKKSDLGDPSNQEFVECEEIFELLNDVLNEVHQLNHSTRFWKYILIKYLYAVRTRKEIIKELDSVTPDLYPINSYSIPSQKEKLKKEGILFIKYLRSLGNKSAIDNLLKEEDEFYMGFPTIPDFEEKENLGKKLPEYFPRLFGNANHDLRSKVESISKRYSDSYQRNIIKGIPKIFVEYFPHIYSSITLYRPQNKTFHVHFCESMYNTVLIAKYVEHGAEFILYQHGSDSAEFSDDADNFISTAHKITLSHIDEFRTWGWSRHDKERPWKAYRLESFQVKYDQHKNDDHYKYDLLLCFPHLGSEGKKHYKTQTDRFFKKLTSDDYQNILARPRRTNKIQSHAHQLNFIDDERVKVSTGLVPMMREMAKCKIVLQITVPSTNFLECIYVNHPTVGILENENPSDLIVPYYEFFLENGVLHKDFNSLVDHLQFTDVDQWWQELTEKPMYQEFKDTFIRRV